MAVREEKISRRGDGGLAGEVSAGICGRGVTAVLLDETRQAATWWPASCQDCGRRLAAVLELGGDGTCRRFNGDRGGVASSSRARSRRGPARCADQGGGQACGACTRCRVVLLRAVLGSVRMLKVADDDLCTARSL
jgi:hypothetical protein